jgi:hypothetical protein
MLKVNGGLKLVHPGLNCLLPSLRGPHQRADVAYKLVLKPLCTDNAEQSRPPDQDIRINYNLCPLGGTGFNPAVHTALCP